MVKLLSILKPKRSWFQYRLKTLFFLVVVVAVPCSWLTWKIEAKRKERQAVVAIETLDGVVSYRWEADGKSHPPGPEWLRRLLGDDFFTDVDEVQLPLGSEDADTAMNYVPALTHLRELSFWNAQLTDVGLKHLEGLTMLKSLSLEGTHITNDGLKHLELLTRLEELFLGGTQVTDNGLKHLEGLTRLERLGLGRTHVTDTGLKHLYGLTELEYLYLEDTQVTDAGVRDLQKALPNCRIVVNFPARAPIGNRYSGRLDDLPNERRVFREPDGEFP